VTLASDPIRVVTLCLLGLVTAVVIVLIIYLVTFVGSMRQTVECLQSVGQQLGDSVTASRTAAQQDRQAQRELLLSQLSDPAQSRTAIDRFLQRLDDADQARAASPPPVRSCT